MENNNIDGGDWKSEGKYVLMEIKRLTAAIDLVNIRLDRINIELSMLKAKSGVWGLIGGMIPVAMMLAWLLLKK